MDMREKEMEEELGGLVVDEHQTLKRSTTETSSKAKLNTFGMGFNRLGAKPLAQKKVVAVQSEDPLKKKSLIGPVGTGMQKFMKVDSEASGKVAPAVKSSVPMLFRKRK